MPHLTLDMTDGLATITFDNPPLSVMTPQTARELWEMLPRLEQDDVRAVVITGSSPDFFIRHFSVEELDKATQGKGARWDFSMAEMQWRLENLPKPVITALNGTAMGGGLELALATDIRVAKDGPFRFGLPEVSVGILPGGGGTQRLSALVGRGRALNMMLRPKLLTPTEALDIGLIDELVPVDSTETALDRAKLIAGEIMRHSALAVAHIKRLARESPSPVTKDAYKLEGKLFGELMHSPEAKALLAGVAKTHKQERETAEG